MALSAFFSQDHADLFRQHGDMMSDYVPQYVEVYAKILVGTMLRNPAILYQSTCGYRSLTLSGTCLLASPMISRLRRTASKVFSSSRNDWQSSPSVYR